MALQIDILTLFPDMFAGPFSESMLKRFQTQGLVQINLHNFRAYATDKHQSVDDTPYGGGVGMVLRVDVLVTALEAILGRKLPAKKANEQVVLLSPKGETFTQAIAKNLAKLDRLVLIAGHYEDVDARISEFIDQTISIGDYVLTGGELPAMVITDAVCRLLPGALAEGATDTESFSERNTLEYPQYTKPAEFRGHKVPDVLVSGNHQAIATWRKEQQQKKEQ